MSTIMQENATTTPTTPTLTATDEDFVFVADFQNAGLPGIAAVVFAGPGIGLKVVVEERLGTAVRNDAINAVLERLFASPSPRQYALIHTDELPGGAA